MKWGFEKSPECDEWQGSVCPPSAREFLHLAEVHQDGHYPLHILLLEQGFEDPFKVGDQILKGVHLLPEMKQDLDKVINQNIEMLGLLLLLEFPG